MKIKIGPAGLGSVDSAEDVLKNYKKKGFGICEIAFTYNVYIKEKDAKKIGKIAKDLGIELSIHAPYFVNLNSDDEKKIEATKKRILKCCEIGHYLQAKNIVFHPGYYGKNYQKVDSERKKEIQEQTYQKIKSEIVEMLEEIKKNKWNVKLCPETMGKVNVFGSPEEIARLVNETKCGFCIDFAHILAREKEVDYEKLKKLFPQKNWHCHFSGIEYTEKGERHHKNLKEKEWKKLFNNLPEGENKNISIVCESPDNFGDSVKGLRVLKED